MIDIRDYCDTLNPVFSLVYIVLKKRNAEPGMHLITLNEAHLALPSYSSIDGSFEVWASFSSKTALNSVDNER